jgi:hypothetical protein
VKRANNAVDRSWNCIAWFLFVSVDGKGGRAGLSLPLVGTGLYALRPLLPIAFLQGGADGGDTHEVPHPNNCSASLRS